MCLLAFDTIRSFSGEHYNDVAMDHFLQGEFRAVKLLQGKARQSKLTDFWQYIFCKPIPFLFCLILVLTKFQQKRKFLLFRDFQGGEKQCDKKGDKQNFLLSLAILLLQVSTVCE